MTVLYQDITVRPVEPIPNDRIAATIGGFWRKPGASRFGERSGGHRALPRYHIDLAPCVKKRSFLDTNGSPSGEDSPCTNVRYRVGVPVLSASPWRGEVEEFGDLGDGFAAGTDVAHGGARVAVSGLGHDQLQSDVLFSEVGRRGVA